MKRLAAFVVVACTAAPLRAEESDAPWSAHARLENGIALYRRGAIDDAIVEFTAAYAISPTPAILFDLGQAYRKKGELAMAITAYRGYLDARPLAPDAPSVRAQVALLEEQLRRDTPPPPPRPAVTLPARSDDHSLRRRAIAAVAATSAVGAIAVGIGGALFARGEANASALTSVTPGSAFDESHRALYDDGRASNNAAIGMFVVGGAAIAGAVTTAILERKTLRPRPRVAFRDGRWVF
jgi:tetratricopeptide (TPR) repeat protein